MLLDTRSGRTDVTISKTKRGSDDAQAREEEIGETCRGREYREQSKSRSHERGRNWRRLKDVPELCDLLATNTQPPPRLDVPEKEGNTPKEAVQPKEAPIVGLVGAGLLASVIMPYFAAVFFVPAALICGAIAIAKRQVEWGTLAIMLSLVGTGSIIYTSNQISSIFTHHPGRISLPQPAFSPPPVVTQAQYDQILNGMTYEQVRSIIGTSGEELSSSDIAGISTVMYSWTNSNGSSMSAMFQNDRLINKAQFGLR